MSATLEANRLSEYFGGAPIISVPGRLFPIETHLARESEIASLVEQLAGDGRNVLVFQPGKKEIADTIQALQEHQLNAEILPLHGEMEAEDQDLVFRHYPRPKVIVATNVAQTSITVDDIDAVVDSGKERRIETVGGIEGLYLRRTARSDDQQRQGRAGRCRPGIYINCDPYEEQLAFPVAEIQRVRLDQLVLRLAIHGFDATELEFFHQPDAQALAEAKRSLHALGAIDKQENVTPIGREMAKLPIDVKYARMIIEAKRLEVVEDVITIAACLEVKGINSNHPDDQAKWRGLIKENRSDLLAQLELFQLATEMTRDQLSENGIHAKSYFRAQEIKQKLTEALIQSARENRDWVKIESCGDRGKIILACVAGMVDHLYKISYGFRGGYNCTNGDGKERVLSDRSVANACSGDWIVGLPIDIQFKDKRYGYQKVMNLVTMITLVDPQTVAEVAPHLLIRQLANFRLADEGWVAYDCQQLFNGTILPDVETIECPWQELEPHLEGVVTLEQVREHIIFSQLEQSKKYGGALFDAGCHYIDNPELIDWSRIKPAVFGRDPATGLKLEAYPAIIKGDGAYWRVEYFRTLEEALAAQEPFDLIHGRSSFNTLRELKIKAQPQPAAKQSQWREIGGRNWICPNGHSIKAPKRATEVVCAVCGASHELAVVSV